MNPLEQEKIFRKRDALDFIEAYQAGLSIEQVKRQYGLKKLVKLASNENSLGPSAKAVSAYKKAADHLFRYPESKSIDLRWMIADKFKLDVGNVIIGNGSDEIIEMLAKTYLTPDSEVVVSESSFIYYTTAAKLMGAKVNHVPMRDLTHHLKAMAEAVTDKTKLIFIANPNNPTGTYNTRAEMEEFLSSLPAHVLPVIDEAYFEYASVNKDYPSTVNDFFKKNFVMTLRTFSKVYGLAGLRVGYGVGPDTVIQDLEKVRPPFNVSGPGQAAAQAALYDLDHIKKSVDNNESQKKEMVKALTKLGFQVVPSAANFLLFRVAPYRGRDLFQKMLRRGFIIRSVDEYNLPDYLRVTIGKPSENKAFLKALTEVVDTK